MFEIKARKNDYVWKRKTMSPHFFRNWKLWEQDVFEVFFQIRSKNSELEEYYEFNFDSLGQAFALNILRPRKIFYTPLEQDFHYTCKSQSNIWKGEIIFDLNSLKGDVYGNFHACLADEYYGSCFSPGKADFHRPDYFQYWESL